MKKILSLAALLLSFASLSWAYDFCAIAPSGQTLYYNFSGSGVAVTYPNASAYYTSELYDGYTMPTGTLIIPDTVSYNGITYWVTSIGNYAFGDCTGLTSVTIPNSVATIGYAAFSNCYGLTSVTIPNGVTSIGHDAFFYCEGLTSVTIPNSVNSIGEEAFYLVRNLIYNGAATDYSPWGALCVNGYIEGDLVYTNSSKTNLVGCAITATSVTIPNSVTAIGHDAFSDCASLTSVTIPNSVTTIGHGAFSHCEGLTSVTIPNSVATIGYAAFANCYGLTSVTIPNSLINIAAQAFFACIGLINVTIPNSVASIGEMAFAYCSSLTEITSLASEAPQLGANAFMDVTTTIPVNIPCGSRDSYCLYWTYFSNFVETAGFTFSAITADSTLGVVQVLTEPSCADPTAVFSATANDGFIFDHWSDDNTDNPRTIVLTSDTALTAYFLPVQEFTITVVSDDPSMGSVTGSGTFAEGSTTTISATANAGYIFVQWHDGNTDNPRTITITADATYTAFFESTQSIEDATDKAAFVIRTIGTSIVVEGMADETVRLFDCMGRCLQSVRAAENCTLQAPAPGVYMLQVADHPAQRVVVLR